MRANHSLDMRMARQQRAVAMIHRNGSTFSERDRGEVLLESGWRDTPRDIPMNSPRGPVTLCATVVAQPPAIRPRSSSTNTGEASAPDLKALKNARSAIFVSGTGQTSDELTNMPLTSNTLMPAMSE